MAIIKWEKLTGEAVVPEKAHPTDAGMDMRVLVKEDGDFKPVTRSLDQWGTHTEITNAWDSDLGTAVKAVLIPPGYTTIFCTGLKCAVPEGYYLEINPRSSLGFKKDVMLANTTGIIDAHYRGEIKVALHNNSPVNVYIEDGERVVQCMLKKVEEVTSVVVDKLDETDRGEGGFGSTGNK